LDIRSKKTTASKSTPYQKTASLTRMRRPQEPPKLISRQVFLPYEEAGAVMSGFVSYLDDKLPHLMLRYGHVDQSDTYEGFGDRLSLDNGKTWEPFQMRLFSRQTVQGKIRYAENAAIYDKLSGKLLTFTSFGLYPSDEKWTWEKTLDIIWRIEMNCYNPRTRQWQHQGVMDLGFPRGLQISFCTPLVLDSGRILVPAFTPLTDEQDCRIIHPLSSYPLSQAQSLVIIGDHDTDGNLHWYGSQLVPFDPQGTCRGLCEGALCSLEDGRLAMLCRGDNSAYPEKPGYKWLCFSQDQGESWSFPRPLLYDDGQPLSSGANGSALFRSQKNNKIYWIGNPALEEPPCGNWPRSPLAMMEIEEKDFTLRRDTMLIIDKRQPWDGPQTQLSNFRFYQDRQTGNVILFLSRFGEKNSGSWKETHYYRYEVEL